MFFWELDFFFFFWGPRQFAYLKRDSVLDQQANFDVHDVQVALQLLVGSDLLHYFLTKLLKFCQQIHSTITIL